MSFSTQFKCVWVKRIRNSLSLTVETVVYTRGLPAGIRGQYFERSKQISHNAPTAGVDKMADKGQARS